MNDQSNPVLFPDNTQQITIHLHCQLAEGAKKYASENGNAVAGVVNEAQDIFLMG